MATDRQIAANRLNAKKSTGPRTADGRRRSRQNAWRHGLTAETVVDVIENATAYQRFAARLRADYGLQTAIEQHLVARLASLLWRLRRATAIESGLMRIHASVLPDPNRKTSMLAAKANTTRSRDRLQAFYDVIPSLNRLNTAVVDEPGHRPDAGKDFTIARSFSRLAKLDSAVFDRLGRYEARLWRQTVQTIVMLQRMEESGREPLFLSNGKLLGLSSAHVTTAGTMKAR